MTCLTDVSVAVLVPGAAAQRAVPVVVAGVVHAREAGIRVYNDTAGLVDIVIRDVQATDGDVPAAAAQVIQFFAFWVPDSGRGFRPVKRRHLVRASSLCWQGHQVPSARGPLAQLSWSPSRQPGQTKVRIMFSLSEIR